MYKVLLTDLFRLIILPSRYNPKLYIFLISLENWPINELCGVWIGNKMFVVCSLI